MKLETVDEDVDGDFKANLKYRYDGWLLNERL
ncbi:hypothetical protein OKW43_007192 [Paraburkholderia sp. WC7.3g]